MKHKTGRLISLASAAAVVLLTLPAGASAQAVRIGATFPVAGATSANHRFPAVSFHEVNDAYLVVWGIWPVHARYVSASGAPLGSAVQVSTALQSSAVKVACGKQENVCLIAWAEESGRNILVMGRLASYNSGSVQFVGAPFVVANTAMDLQFAPSVAYSDKEFLVTWSLAGNIFGQRVTSAGGLAGGIITISSGLAIEFGTTAAYNSSTNEYLVGFEFEQGLANGVAGQRVEAGTGNLVGTWTSILASIKDRYPEIAYNSKLNQYMAITSGWLGNKWMLHGAIADGNAQPLTASLPLALNCGGDGMGLTYNSVSNTYFAVSQDAFVGDMCGVEISASGVAGSPFYVTAGAAGTVQPRVAADGARPRFLAVGSNNFTHIMGQLLGASGPVAPPAPLATSPRGLVNTASPTYFWQPSAGATQYLLWITDSAGVTHKSWHVASAIGCGNGTSTCSVKPGVVLPQGTTSWWVKGWNAEAGEGPWNAGLTFAYILPVAPPKATLVSPTADTPTNNPSFKWNAVLGAEYYQLWVRDKTGVRVQMWYSADEAGCGSGAGICSIVAGVHLMPGTGIWWVQTWNSVGVGPWSAGLEFVISVPPPLSPMGDVVSTTPTFKWVPLAGATHYELFVRDSTGVRLDAWYTADVAGCASGTCAINPGVTLTAGPATWWVRSWAPGDSYSSWSSPGNFRAGFMPGVVQIAPSGALTGLPTIQFSWYAVEGAMQYYLWVTDSGGVRIQDWYTASEAGCASGTGVCSIRLTPTLIPGASHWWVQPWHSSVGHGPWGPGKSFSF